MDLIDALRENKNSKGQRFGEVLQCIENLEDPNEVIAFDRVQHSPLGLSIALSFNELQSRETSELLIRLGAYADDAQVPGQKHNKAINQALKKAQYDVALMLVENSARMDDVVHELMRRPRGVKEASGQMKMEQLLWCALDPEGKKNEGTASMASLISCEVLTGNLTNEDIRQEICTLVYASDEKNAWDNSQYFCSNLEDACQVLNNPSKALDRLSSAMERWIDGVYSPQMRTKDGIANPNDLAVRYRNIPSEFWAELPVMAERKKARQQAQEMDDTTPRTHVSKPSRRI